MNSRFFLLLLCSFSLYSSEKFPELTEKFLAKLQQYMTTTPSPEALDEVGTLHATL